MKWHKPFISLAKLPDYLPYITLGQRVQQVYFIICINVLSKVCRGFWVSSTRTPYQDRTWYSTW